MPKQRSLYCLKCGSVKIALKNGGLRCRPCATQKDIAYYHSRKSYRMKRREQYIMRKYGVTLDCLDNLLAAQRGRRLICLKAWQDCEPATISRYEDSYLLRLCVDHDHLTGKVRGLLCIKCNSAIGELRDDPNLVRAAKVYLLSCNGEPNTELR